MARGGERKPPARSGPSGPGRFSKRTDGQAVPDTPGLSGPDLQYGDVQRLESAQAVAPLPGGVPSPKTRPNLDRRPTGAPAAAGPIPRHLLTVPPPSQEPTTTGLDVGEGMGSEALIAREPAPDLGEQALEYLYQTYGNQDAADMLYRLREERAAKVPMTPTPQAPAAPPVPQE